jgi:hypothetical protein
MKTITVVLLLVASCSPVLAKDNNFRYEQPRNGNYSTKTYPDYRAPLSSSSPSTGQNSGKSCVVVNDRNYFTKEVTQVVKCY